MDADDPIARIHARMPQLREHAYSLAKEGITDDLMTLQQSQRDPMSPHYRQQKEHILTKLKRYVPGATASIGAIQTASGEISSDPSVIANSLQEHWKRTLTSQPID